MSKHSLLYQMMSNNFIFISYNKEKRHHFACPYKASSISEAFDFYKNFPLSQKQGYELQFIGRFDAPEARKQYMKAAHYLSKALDIDYSALVRI